MKVGLVLEGGGMRGLYTSGILDTFLENGIEVDGIIGVSAGAVFGVDYVSRQKGRTINYTKKYAGNKNYMGIKSFITTGNIINKDFAYYEVPQKLDIFDDDTFRNSNVDFYATVTNVHTGQAEYLKIQSVFEQMEIMRATSAMPFVSRMIKLENGDYYLDGAIADSIPVEAMKKLGYDRIIVVLTRPFGYVKRPYPKVPMKIKYHGFPVLFDAIMNRHIIYNEEITSIVKQENAGEIIVLRPSEKIKVARIEKNPKALQAMYELGINDANQKLEEIKQFINC